MANINPLWKYLTMINKQSCDIGIIGLGVMGRNLLLNMADHGFTVAGYDKDPNQVNSLRDEAKLHTIYDTQYLKEFIELLKRPRAILILVPAGKPVDAVIYDLLPYLDQGDLIIDAGNSYYKDTDLRTQTLKAKGIQFLGMGISGGEEGARHGPSMMPGGKKEAYERIRGIVESIAAKVNGEPCVTYIGTGSSGHFVKMVHNGIEYAIMQLISECYDLMKRGLGYNNEQLCEVYSKWNEGELNSYLIEITSHIFKTMDNVDPKKHLIDLINDVAKQNGTGMWTALSAMELQVPTPTINIAVTMRDLSVLQNERKEFSAIYSMRDKFNEQKIPDQILFLHQLEEALFIAIIMVYAQGMALLQTASLQYQYDLNLEAIARIWRGGCIIRSQFLEKIVEAFQQNKNLSNLLGDPSISSLIEKQQASLRIIVSTTAQCGIPTPAMMDALSYFDAFRSERLPTNLIQAQRDYFGSHGYERLDVEGNFHTKWEEK